MSLPSGSAFRALSLPGLFISLSLIAACTVQPLYSGGSTFSGSQTGVAADLSSIVIKPVETRYAQAVRNHLIFLFNNGGGQPASGLYTLSLSVTALKESAAVVQIAKENEPSAGTITLIASYLLTRTDTGEKVAVGRRQISSSYDVPRQEFGAVRAERDAENRAARELADLLRLVIAQDLSRAAK
jgi:LPS-assembly lipoprotein